MFLQPSLERWLPRTWLTGYPLPSLNVQSVKPDFFTVKSGTVAARNQATWGSSALAQSPKIQKRKQFSGVLKVSPNSYSLTEKEYGSD